MRYPKPANLLHRLAEQGTSATRIEALRLLSLPNFPQTWPACPRRSVNALLRRLCCDRRKSGQARLAAFKAVCFGLSLEAQAILDKDRPKNGRRSTQSSNQ